MVRRESARPASREGDEPFAVSFGAQLASVGDTMGDGRDGRYFDGGAGSVWLFQ